MESWTYHISNGALYLNGVIQGYGYSGHGPGLNNSAQRNVPFVGPVPEGKWSLSSSYTHPELGPLVFNLTAQPGTETFGRNLFRIHGDNSSLNHTASDGCIILSRQVRLAIDKSTVRDLVVVP